MLIAGIRQRRFGARRQGCQAVRRPRNGDAMHPEFRQKLWPLQRKSRQHGCRRVEQQTSSSDQVAVDSDRSWNVQ